MTLFDVDDLTLTVSRKDEDDLIFYLPEDISKIEDLMLDGTLKDLEITRIVQGEFDIFLDIDDYIPVENNLSKIVNFVESYGPDKVFVSLMKYITYYGAYHLSNFNESYIEDLYDDYFGSYNCLESAGEDLASETASLLDVWDYIDFESYAEDNLDVVYGELYFRKS